MQRIVLLGHTGFIGTALSAHLRDTGREVLGFSSSTVDLRRPDGVGVLADVVDQRTTVVFASTITREKGDTVDTLLHNVAMAGHLAAFLEAHRPGKIICLSSDAVYPMQDGPVVEDTPVNPGGTLYAIGKYTAECVLRRSAEAAEIPLLVVRPTGVFGPGDTHNSYGPNAFVRSAVKDRSLRLFGKGEERRDHLYIGDLVRVVTRLLDGGATGVFNLATGVSRSFAEVAETLCRIASFPITVTYAPRRSPVTHREFDVSRLVRRSPGFVFTDFADAMGDTLASALAAAPKV